MTEDKNRTKTGAITQHAIGIAANVVPAVAGVAVANDLVKIGTLAGVGFWLNLSAPYVADRVDEFVRAIRRIGPPPDKVNVEVEDAVRASKASQSAWLQAIKTLLFDSLDSAAVEPLASLTREYVYAEQPPDFRFRSFARVLSESSAEELKALTMLLEQLLSLDNDATVFRWKVDVNTPPDNKGRTRVEVYDVHEAGGQIVSYQNYVGYELLATLATKVVVRRMESVGLADLAQTTGVGVCVLVSKHDCKWMLKHITPVPPL